MSQQAHIYLPGNPPNTDPVYKVKPEHWGWDHLQVLMLVDRIIERKGPLALAPNPYFYTRADHFDRLGWPTEKPSKKLYLDRHSNIIPNHDDWCCVGDFWDVGLMQGERFLTWTALGAAFVATNKRWAKQRPDRLPSVEEILIALRP